MLRDIKYYNQLSSMKLFKMKPIDYLLKSSQNNYLTNTKETFSTKFANRKRQYDNNKNRLRNEIKNQNEINERHQNQNKKNKSDLKIDRNDDPDVKKSIFDFMLQDFKGNLQNSLADTKLESRRQISDEKTYKNVQNSNRKPATNLTLKMLNKNKEFTRNSKLTHKETSTETYANQNMRNTFDLFQTLKGKRSKESNTDEQRRVQDEKPADVKFYDNIKIEDVFRKTNRRKPRSIETSLNTPFYIVRKESNDNEIVNSRSEEAYKQDIFLETLNFERLIPQTSLFYFINTPIRMLKHFHSIRRQIDPVITSVPKVMKTSNKYIEKFARNLHRDTFKMFNEMIESFQFKPYDYFTRGITKRHVNIDEVPPFNKEQLNDIDDDDGATDNYDNNLIDNVVGELKKFETKSNDGELCVESLKMSCKQSKKIPSVLKSSQILSALYSPTLNNLHENNLNTIGEIYESSGNKIRRKRTLLKVIDESELKEFLREKLPNYDGESNSIEDEGELIRAVTPKVLNDENYVNDKDEKRYVMEKFKPKVIIDDNGDTYLEINGNKEQIKRDKSTTEDDNNNNEEMVSMVSLMNKLIPKNQNVEEVNVKDTIVRLIRKAKMVKDQPVGTINTFDKDKYINIIKDKITSILPEIEKLIHADFEKEFELFEDLLKLQLLKNNIVKEWKVILINDRINDMKERVRLLNAIHDAQKLKEKIVCDITEKFHSTNYHHKRKLIQVLLTVQKLQSIFLKVIEEFGDKLNTGTSFDVEKEIKYVELIESVTLVSTTRRDYLEKHLKDVRDEELKRQMNLLQDLRDVLERDGGNTDDKKLIDLSKIIWEINNLEKLQRDSFKELNKKLKFNFNIRREMKIIFDLQKQLETCEINQYELIDDILEKNKDETQTDEPIEENNILKKFNLNQLRLNLFLKEQPKLLNFKTNLKSLTRRKL